MHRHYRGLFSHAESMLMAEHPVSDVLFSLYARRHLGKSWGRKMKVRGISNIHPRQLFMNIKEQLWMEAGSHHFILISLKHWNTLQLNGFIPSKVCGRHSVATIKFNWTILIHTRRQVKEGKTCSLHLNIFFPAANIFEVWLLLFNTDERTCKCLF